jgi:hypothetical protein
MCISLVGLGTESSTNPFELGNKPYGFIIQLEFYDWPIISFWRKTAPSNYWCYYCKERAFVSWPSLPFNSVKQIPWKATSRSAIQELLNILLNPKFHYHVHRSLPLILVLSRMTAVYITAPYFSNIYFNIISHWCLRPPSGLSPSDFPTRTINAFLLISSCLCFQCECVPLQFPPHCLPPFREVGFRASRHWLQRPCIRSEGWL